MIVIDSSAFLKFLMKEEGWEKVLSYLDPHLDIYAVDMLMIESANVIWRYMRKYGRISREQAIVLYNYIKKLVKNGVIKIEPSSKYLLDALNIAIEHDISVYDALFLAQAQRLNLKLITSDRKQKEVAKRIDVKVIYV